MEIDVFQNATYSEMEDRSELIDGGGRDVTIRTTVDVLSALYLEASEPSAVPQAHLGRV
jgi:hypothetical protein